jgi:biopolymer transport protein TolR
MAMTTGRTGKSMGEMNVTPMIDVLLVLLVIFMLAQPLLQRSMDVQLPVEKAAGEPGATAIVLDVKANGEMTLNTMPIAPGQLEERLRSVYANRPDRILFVKADGAVPYGDVIRVMDTARGAGVEVLGAMLPTG